MYFESTADLDLYKVTIFLQNESDFCDSLPDSRTSFQNAVKENTISRISSFEISLKSSVSKYAIPFALKKFRSKCFSLLYVLVMLVFLINIRSERCYHYLSAVNVFLPYKLRHRNRVFASKPYQQHQSF